MAGELSGLLAIRRTPGVRKALVAVVACLAWPSWPQALSALEGRWADEILMAKEVLDDRERRRDPVQHLRACGMLASSEWAQQTLLLRQVAGVLSGDRLEGRDIADLASRHPLLREELLAKSEGLVKGHPRRYREWRVMLERSRWRTISANQKDMAARWYMLREQSLDEADYLALRLYTGINPEARSDYYNGHCR